MAAGFVPNARASCSVQTSRRKALAAHSLRSRCAEMPVLQAIASEARRLAVAPAGDTRVSQQETRDGDTYRTPGQHHHPGSGAGRGPDAKAIQDRGRHRCRRRRRDPDGSRRCARRAGLELRDLAQPARLIHGERCEIGGAKVAANRKMVAAAISGRADPAKNRLELDPGQRPGVGERRPASRTSPRRNPLTALSLTQASAILEAALAASRQAGHKPMAVVVLDDAGHLKAAQREDGASMFRVDIATGKAWAAIGMGASSRTLAQRAKDNPNFFVALASTAQGRFLPQTGAVLILDADGAVLGAVGASGGSGDDDEAICITGVRAAGLRHA